MNISFSAPEYQADGSFQETAHDFEGSEARGWVVRRNGRPALHLGPGYTPVKSQFCGVCSTDLARRFLPYPLPQLIGHEAVGLSHGRPVVVEINASHAARGLQWETERCPFCSGGMSSHCPERITLGIDRLGGGFAPFFLAPVKAVIELPPEIDLSVATLTEPFAAALQALEASPPRNGERAAVLGAGRLGLLLIAARSPLRGGEASNA